MITGMSWDPLLSHPNITGLWLYGKIGRREHCLHNFESTGMKGGIEIKLLYFFFDTVYIFAAVDKDKHHGCNSKEKMKS